MTRLLAAVVTRGTAERLEGREYAPLSKTLGLLERCSRVHVVDSREGLNRLFVALAPTAGVSPSRHRRSLRGRLGGEPRLRAELAMYGS